MSFLFADTEPAPGLLAYLRENWLLLMPALLGFTAIYLLLPKARRPAPLLGGMLGVIALVLGARELLHTDANVVETILFLAFSALAISAGVMMITQQNPVHAALSFALVVLSTCGLFLLLAAPFLMAATIIVYAGAIVVTFLFVIMLAQQEGPSNADQRSREPFLASLAGCILLGSLTCILHKSYEARDLDEIAGQLKAIAAAKVSDRDDVQPRKTLAEAEAEVKLVMGDPAKAEFADPRSEFTKPLLQRFRDPAVAVHLNNMNQKWLGLPRDAKKYLAELNNDADLALKELEAMRRRKGSLALDNVPGKQKIDGKQSPSHYPPGKLPAANVAALGKTLFTDYLIPVEMAAVLLLVATIGAIAIAGRRAEELR